MKDLKNIQKNNFKSVFSYKMLLLMISTVIITSCSKLKNEVEPSIGGGLGLIVKVEGVDSDITSPNLKASTGNTNKVSWPVSNKLNQETFTKDDLVFDVQSNENSDLSGFDNNLEEEPKDKSNLKAASYVPMENSIRYRLLIYTTADVFVTSIEGTVGQDERIPVVIGNTYKWYAYSYNKDATIPTPNTSNPVLTTPTNTTLLYASGQVTPTAEGTILPITFKHQLTQLKVEVKESSGFRAVLNTTGKFSRNDYVKTSTFDLLTGKKTGALTSANVTTLNFENQSDGDVIKRVAQYYTADDALTSYGVKINSLNIQYTSTTTRLMNEGSLPSLGDVSFSFAASPTSKKGYILKGSLQVSFILPTMRILPFSNDHDWDTYRFHPNSAPGAFMRAATNFGPTSKYVKIQGLTIDPPTIANLATANAAGWARFKALMSTPSAYPDVLILANWYNYFDDQCWDLIKKYIDAGGNVFYTHDEPDPVYEKYAQRGIGNILGQKVTMSDINEFYGVYKFVDTPEAVADSVVLNGPFGDVRPYHWGQDRVGTSYVNGYTGSDVIAYSTHAQNKVAPSRAGMSCFRHKTKSFFFVGDGGFYNNANGTSAIVNHLEFGFRINTTTKFPILAAFGQYALAGSPAYGTPGTNVNGGFTIANSFMFGNLMAHMLNRAHYYGINRN